MLREARGFGQLGDELRRKLRLAVVVAPQLTDVDGRDASRLCRNVGVVFAGRQPLSDLRTHGAFVAQPSQLRELPSTVLDPAGRHHRLLIPAQNTRRGSEQGHVDRVLDEAFVGMNCHGSQQNTAKSVEKQD